jgi:hypothetical protein
MFETPGLNNCFTSGTDRSFFPSPSGPDWPCKIYQELTALHKVARALSQLNIWCWSAWFVCLYHYSRMYLQRSNKKQRHIYIITTQNFSILDSVSATNITQWHSLANIISAGLIKPICYWPITNQRDHSEICHFTNVTNIKVALPKHGSNHALSLRLLLGRHRLDTIRPTHNNIYVIHVPSSQRLFVMETRTARLQERSCGQILKIIHFHSFVDNLLTIQVHYRCSTPKKMSQPPAFRCCLMVEV